MTKRLLALAFFVALVVPIIGQSKPSIQGVWRAVEVTITSPNPLPGSFPKGTHTNLQPELLIFTGKHYSLIADTAAQPRPAAAVAVPGKPTLEELQSRWGPFIANAGTYEISGDTVTRHVVVAKNPALQGGKNFVRHTFKIDGNNLWLTAVEGARGKNPNPSTVKYVRVE
jgi:hypothetical protein